jgi:hypothetical protein
MHRMLIDDMRHPTSSDGLYVLVILASVAHFLGLDVCMWFPPLSMFNT